ncbi:hypothetical protein CLG96_00830 [Sphingomonas oleivorans]|uniref:Lipoprotein n=1 Tax=Sphingomonas oleivorans TaxID=1735121 RepID=A0A2T5G301_9SPHN|nr:hypothetical protein [Sphingomonas oleivorans]PTQ13524.1 hypothetical protein CLG96_00830 [Sphingomonas oleivorans]
MIRPLFLRTLMGTAIALVALAAAPAIADRSPTTAPPLAFRIDEGRNINAFVREGPVAAHLLLRSGGDPRILVAFPAGNSGVGLWFEHLGRPVAWTLTTPPRPVTAIDGHGRPLRGIEAEAVIDATRLDVRQAVLSSIRVLRDYQSLGKAPAEILTPPIVSGNRLSWSRDRLDGAAGYRLVVEAVGGTVAPSRIMSANGPIRLKITALTGETPLSPLGGLGLLTDGATDDRRARDALAFLSYREKYLAGSWRFDTYFGRDTLMSVRLLMPVLQPEAVEAGVGAVLARLSPGGEVAHEEDIGEYAVLRHLKQSGAPGDTPIHDYAMIDDDFMLAPVAAAWLLDEPRSRGRAPAFLAARMTGGEANGDALVRNLLWVMDRTAAFASSPTAANLVGLKQGHMAGQWRDSGEGLGRGRYPYDVNAIFVPAALRAIDGLVRSGQLDAYLSPERRKRLAGASERAELWERRAAALFALTISAERAAEQLDAYSAEIGVPSGPALAALSGKPITFNALALDAEGRPVPVLHSDEGFGLLFGNPAPMEVARTVAAMMRPFPAGLMTDAGLLVANPAFADPATRKRLGNSAYHGTVIWSWQQAMLAAGLDRQLARHDLPAEVRTILTSARTHLWRVIENANAVRTSELWSWSYANGGYRVEPFGQRGTDEDESNAAQLWSTIFLALRPPGMHAR